MTRSRRLVLASLIATACLTGCSRQKWRERADHDAYCIIEDRLADTPWVPRDFDLNSDPRSRLADFSDPDFTPLPDPEPRLYEYQIPPLESESLDLHDSPPSGLPAVPPSPSAAGYSRNLNRQREKSATEAATIIQVAAQEQDTEPSLIEAGADESATEEASNQVNPEQWNALPDSVQQRMLEFRQLMAVYQTSFGDVPGENLLPQGRGLTLESIIEVGLLNSREFQTQKETLYRAALAVSLEQFAYTLKFTPFGNGGDVVNRQINVDSDYVSDLRTSANAEVDKLLVTGGTFVGRFANNVLLTFNRPDGFAADVSSQLLFDISQPLMQRDIRFEPLTRAERNLVYAARSYLRFRKTFFVQLATSYYQILRSYRQIAIESQNYFSLSGAHKQALKELEAGLRSRIQTEQIEQNMLAGRSRLISAGVTLERALDRLKLDLGIPPELAFRLDLYELEEVTRRDETAVAAEAVRRTRSRLLDERNRPDSQVTLLVNAAVVLQQRIADWVKSRANSSGPVDLGQLQVLGAQLALADARLAVEAQRRGLAEVEAALEPAAVRLVQRRLELLDAQSRQIGRHLALSGFTKSGESIQDLVSTQLKQFQDTTRILREQLAVTLDAARLEDLPKQEAKSRQLLLQGEKLLEVAQQLPGDHRLGATEKEEQAQVFELVDRVLSPAERLLEDEAAELTPVEVELDDAMLTGLALRLDLMNRRGELADARRAAKLAADDLRSVLNLQATEILSTDAFGPYDFRADTARTELRLSVDLPFNRQQQRNVYRNSLIGYQVARRNVMAQEDTIKFAVRDDLRNLALARTQYQIGIASAALANERVTSTQLELALGFPNVAARDFLEAQDAFRLAVGGVADNHLGYIVNRIQFFLDLELLELDDRGFWSGVRDEKLQPVPQYRLNPANGSPYGDLPSYPWYSRELRELHPSE